MKKIILFAFILFAAFTANAQRIGAGGRCHVIGDPNLISDMQVQDQRQHCTEAVDTVTGDVWRYVVTNTVGTRWVKDAVIIARDTFTIVIDGQSNAIGQGSASTRNIVNKGNLKTWNGSAWVSPTLGTAPFNVTGADNIGLRFAERMAIEHPEYLVRLIVSGNGGQPISYWLGGAGVTATEAQVTASGTSAIDTYIWVQGEADNARTHAAYTADFYTLLSTWKSKSYWLPYTKHISVGLYNGVGQTGGFQNAALDTIGIDSIENTCFASVENIPVYDFIHYTNEGLYEIGNDRVYNTFLNCPYNYVPYSGAEADLWTPTNSNADIYRASNVGINKVNPVFALDVVGITRSIREGVNGIGTAASAIFGTDARTAGDGIGIAIQGRNTSNNPVTYTQLISQITNPNDANISADLIFNNAHNGGTGERMRLTSDGRLGIGTSNPVWNLDVNGIARVKRQGTDGAGTAGALFVATDAKTINDGISIAFFGHNAANAEYQYGDIATVITNPTVGSETADFAFRLKENGAISEKARILSSGSMLLSGLSGAGTRIVTANNTGVLATTDISTLFSSLPTFTAATSDAANTAATVAVGEQFWWKPTTGAGKILMQKE